jgi:hypothetical protein
VPQFDRYLLRSRPSQTPKLSGQPPE